MRFVAWFEIVVGVSIAGLWTMFAVLTTAAVVTSVILLRSTAA